MPLTPKLVLTICRSFNGILLAVFPATGIQHNTGSRSHFATRRKDDTDQLTQAARTIETENIGELSSSATPYES